MLKIIAGLFVVLVVLSLIGLSANTLLFSYEGKSSGVEIADAWPAEKVCSAVYERLKKATRLSEYDKQSFQNSSCDVRLLEKPLTGLYANYTPFSVIYSNAIAARVTVKGEQLVIVGWSTSGRASSWYN